MTKTRLWCLLSFLLLLLVVGVNIFLNFKYRTLLAEVNEFSLKISQSKAQSNELIAIETNIRSTVLNKEKLNSFFVSRDGIIAFIENLEALMKQSNVIGEVKDVSDKISVAGPNGATYFDFTVSFYGNWSSITQYLALIENLPYLISIESLNLSYGAIEGANKVDKSNNVWKAILSLKVGTFPKTENNEKQI